MTDAFTQPSSSSQSTTNRSMTASQNSSSKPTSAINSPKPSRDTSPVQKSLKTGISSTSTGMASRKNSQDHSPNRAPSGSSSSNVPSVPSAAAVQRALSALGKPQIPTPTATEPSTDTPGAKNHRRGVSGDKPPRWPTSPRLKSPPPSATSMKPSVFSPRKSDQGAKTPKLVIERASPSSTTFTDVSASTTDVDSDDTTPRSGMRTPGRGVSGTGSTLETVQESSLPATPAIGTIKEPPTITTSNDTAPERSTDNPMEDAFTKSTRTNIESGSESGGQRSGNAKAHSSKRGRKPGNTNDSIRTTAVLPRKSLTHLKSPRSKAASEGSLRNMIVETETVSSIPQVAVGGGAGERGLSGRIESGSSLRLKPSTETIRPKKEKKKGVRKTPSFISGTCGLLSTHSYLFVTRLTPPHARVSSLYLTNEDLESLPAPPPQPSMLTIRSTEPVSSKADIFEAKVASAVDEAESTDSAESFMYESNPADSRRHIGRYGRGRGGGAHPSLLGSESPFPLAARDDDAADDERTPLLTSVRFRSRGGRRPYAVSAVQPATRGWWTRVAGWIVLTVFAICLLSAIAGGLVGFSNPLRDVYVKDIRNVLASEPEIMLDLRVHAVNSNLMTIQVSDLDVNIFAKSKHVGTNKWWREHASSSGVDEGNDPIEDPEGDSQIMLLGRIFEFDSPLIFEASPLRHHSQSSVGELRLSNPGNETEEGGTERWEKVIKHPFELIVRGVLKYQLPLSSRIRTASIRASVIVHPDEGADTTRVMRTSETHTPYPIGSDMVVPRGGRHGVRAVGFVA